MPPENKEPKYGYLHNVLSEGAKPFRYRSAVRNLLGLPTDNEGGLSFLQGLPPVGFRYSNNLSADDGFLRSCPSLQRHEELRGFSSNDVSGKDDVDPLEYFNLQGKKVVNKKVAAGFDNFGCHEYLGKNEPEIEVLKEHKVQEPPSLAKGIGHIDKLDGGPSTQDLSIPGISTQKNYFPALRPATQTGSKAPRENVVSMNSLDSPASGLMKFGFMQSAEPDLRPGNQASPLESNRQKKLQKTSRIGKNNHGAEASFKKSLDTPSFGSPKSPRKNNLQKSAINETTMNRAETTVFLSGKKHYGVIQQKNDTETQLERDQVSASFKNTRQQGLRTNIPVPEDDSRLASATIDQLRQSVHSLVSKATRQQETSDNQDQQLVQPQAIQPPREIVIIRQSPIQPISLRAFWERNYLARFHLNILR